MTFKTKLLILALVPVAFALVGCGGDGQAISPTAIDTAPPATPFGLEATAKATSVTLSWSPNTTDADFSGFKVYRVVYSSVGTSNEPRMMDLTFNQISEICSIYRFNFINS